MSALFYCRLTYQQQDEQTTLHGRHGSLWKSSLLLPSFSVCMSFAKYRRPRNPHKHTVQLYGEELPKAL